MSEKIICGDALEVLKTLESESVDCVITSPPYFRLRDYGHNGQIGLESTPEQYTENLVAVFRETKRVVKKEGTLWLNLGDSYNGNKTGNTETNKNPTRVTKSFQKKAWKVLKEKDMIGIPWRVAFALQADGWYLRSDIIWAKPNPMPESVTDRPTRSHEYIFLLSKNKNYYYDSDAIKEKGTTYENRASGVVRDRVLDYDSKQKKMDKQRGHSRRHAGFNERWDAMTKSEQGAGLRNKRDVWNIATRPYTEAHFATFPEKLVEPMVMAGCPEGGTVLDPFSGAATTGLVAKKLGRNYIGIELNPEYVALSERRLNSIPSSLFDPTI